MKEFLKKFYEKYSTWIVTALIVLIVALVAYFNHELDKKQKKIDQIEYIDTTGTYHKYYYETKFKGDYTQIPRGRVAWTIDKFIVLVGKWAEPIQDELTELLEKEFSLPYFEFVYDEHWDLGHGWSGDMP